MVRMYYKFNKIARFKPLFRYELIQEQKSSMNVSTLLFNARCYFANSCGTGIGIPQLMQDSFCFMVGKTHLVFEEVASRKCIN